MKFPLRTCLAVCLASLMFAPSAMADTIRYDIPPGPNYTVDNEQGITKVTFNACLANGQPTTLGFTTVIDTTKVGATATYKVIKEPGDSTGPEEDGGVPYVFDPATVTTTGGIQSISTTLTFTPDELSNSPILLRAKLDPDEGSGLGEGPGFMVRIECVSQAFIAASGGAQGVPAVPVPAPAVAVQRGQAVCVGVRRVKLRANRVSTIVVTVRTTDEVRRAFVRIIGPGIRRSALTNNQGQVTFRVKPKRAGTLFVQSNACVGADKLGVLGAVNPSGVGTGRPSYTG